MHVSNTCSKRFRCFTRMLQVLSGCCICCYGYTRMFLVFHLFFSRMLQVFSIGCFKSRPRGSTCSNGPCGWRTAACHSRLLLLLGRRSWDTVRARSCLLWYSGVRSSCYASAVDTGEHTFYAKHVLGNDNILVSSGRGVGVRMRAFVRMSGS
jgi:hypothetical protein